MKCQVSPGEYVPSEPDQDLEDAVLETPEEYFRAQQDPFVKAVDKSTQPRANGQEDDNLVETDNVYRGSATGDGVQEYDWVDDSQLEAELKEATTGVGLVTLRYFVGLKSKTGADVTSGIQQIVLRITQQLPYTCPALRSGH